MMPRRFTDAEAKEMVREYDRNPDLTVSELAFYHDCEPKLIRRYLRRFGATVRRKRPRRKKRLIDRLGYDSLPRSTTTRPCITCGGDFESEGAHNRMCDPCREADDGLPDYGVAI